MTDYKFNLKMPGTTFERVENIANGLTQLVENNGPFPLVEAVDIAAMLTTIGTDMAISIQESISIDFVRGYAQSIGDHIIKRAIENEKWKGS